MLIRQTTIANINIRRYHHHHHHQQQQQQQQQQQHRYQRGGRFCSKRKEKLLIKASIDDIMNWSDTNVDRTSKNMNNEDGNPRMNVLLSSND
jgi:hypothetical protein